MTLCDLLTPFAKPPTHSIRSRTKGYTRQALQEHPGPLYLGPHSNHVAENLQVVVLYSWLDLARSTSEGSC